MERGPHWDRVYAKDARHFSWFEEIPDASLRLIEAAGLSPTTRIIDIGGGDSHLVDELLRRGVRAIVVLDVSSTALARARQRLGPMAERVSWIEADVTGAWTCPEVDIWHDRAVFHFLTAETDRAAYVRHLRRTIAPGGTLIIATFAPDGPASCSGLPVRRYSPQTLARELGGGFTLEDAIDHVHRTPWGADQAFQYSRFSRP